jgi:hypothetical protein
MHAVAAGEEEAAEGRQESAVAVARVLSGAVALVVFRGALAELPASVGLHTRFLDALQPFAFPGVAAIAEVTPTSSRPYAHNASLLTMPGAFDHLVRSLPSARMPYSCLWLCL